MLTKEERKAIAERISEEVDYTENDEVYEALIGEEIPGNVCTYSADNLTRKNPVSVQSISKRMQGVLEDYLFSVDSNLHTELVSIADQLKELAGKDE